MSIFFEHEGLTYELPDGTTPEVAKQKILTHLGKSPSISNIDKIPGGIPNEPTQQFPFQQSLKEKAFTPLDPNMSMLDAGLAGAKQAAQAPLDMLETVASVGSMMTSGMASGAVKAYNAFATGQDPEKAFHEGNETLTYQPRLPGGQELTGQVNKGLAELMPLAGHTGGFHIPLRPTRQPSNVKPATKVTPETTPINVDPIYKKVKESIDTEYKNAKAAVAGAERRGQKGTPEWDSLMSTYLEADLNRQKINKELGIAEDFSIKSDQELINQREAFIERTRSGKQLSDAEIEAYDNLMIELDKRVKLEDQKKQKPVEEPVVERPVEPTERPVEAVKAEEPIPEPIRAAEKPYEWDRSQEWKSENAPDENTWRILNELENERLEAEASAKEIPEGSTGTPTGNTGRLFKTGTPEFAKHIDIQISKFESIRDSLKNQLEEYNSGVTPSGTLDFKQLESKLNWAEEKLNTFYDLRNENAKEGIKPTEYSPITPESLYKYKKNIAKQIINLQDKIRKLEEQPTTEANQRQVLKLKDQIAKRKQLIDKREASFNRQGSSKDLEAYKKDEGLPTLDASLLDEAKGQDTIVPKSIDEIMDASAHPVKEFMDRPELFDTIEGADTYIDKRVAEIAPNIQDALTAFVKDLGFEKEKIYVVLDTAGKEEIKFQGNSAIISLNPERIEAYKKALINDPKTGPFTRTLSEPQFKMYLTAKILSHELGHIVLRKFLKISNPTEGQFRKLLDDFNSYLKDHNIDPVTFTSERNIKAGAEYHKMFDEFFAERVSKALINDSLLNKFGDKRFNLNESIQKIVNSARDWLKSKGINIDIPAFKDDLIRTIINDNREAIKKGSENYWNQLELDHNTKLLDRVGFNPSKEENRPFANKTYQEIGSITVEDLEGNMMKWANENIGHSDIVNLAVDGINKLGSSVAINFFGKTTLSTIYNRYPIIKKTNFLIRNAERQAQTFMNKLSFGDVVRGDWDSARIWQKFSKMKNPDSIYSALKITTDREAYNALKVLEQGREYNRQQIALGNHNGTLDYAGIAQQYGNHLTANEKRFYQILSDMELKAHRGIQNIQRNLGKTNLLPFSDGYFPAVRRGEYAVSMYYGNTLGYLEFFPTKAAAEAAKNKMAQHPQLKNFTISDVLHKDDVPFAGMLETGQMLMDYLDKNAPFPTNIDANFHIQKALDKMTEGSRLGKHHEYREDVPGYKGSEILLTPEEQGRNFKTAIQDHIKDYASGIRTMIIKSKLDPVLYNSSLKKTHPEEFMVMEQMRNSALNIVPNKFEAFDNAIHNFVDSVAESITERVLHKDFKPEEAVATSITHFLTSTFYLLKVLPKLSMAVVQALSPIQSIRHAAYQGGFRATKNFGKGLWNFFSKDPELYDSLYKISQTTDTIEPQFINALHLQGKNKIVEFVKDWVLMRKPQEATDVLSRAITYSFMYTHYRDLGLSIPNAEMYALHGTDATMAAYSSGETAPIFKKTGTLIGENVRPLQTYGQSQFGALIADINHFKTKDPSTWAPLVIYGITSTMMGGAVTGAIVSNYELYRLILAKFGYMLPSALDMVSTVPNFLEGVVEDPDAQTKLLAYGLQSELTGIDIGASARTTDSLLTTLVGIVDGHAQYDRIMPTLGTAGLAVSGGATIGKKVLGGNVSDKEMRDALTAVSPVGPIGWGIKELAGVNDTKVMGQPTDNIAVGTNSEALMPRGPAEKVAAPLGLKSTQERFLMDKNLENTREEEIIQDRINKYLNLYNENPKPELLQELVKLGVDGKNLENALKIRINRALIPQEIRFFTSGANSTVPNNMKSARRINRIFNFGDK